MVPEKHLPSVDALYQRAMQWIKETEYEEAIATFNRLLEINPQHIDALTNLGFTFLRTQRPRPALTLYRRALKLLPHNPAILNDIGNCYRALGDFPKAISFYEKALKQQPDHIHGLYNLVSCDHPSAAVIRQLHTLHQKPDYTGEPRMLACYALGKAYDDQGELRRAFPYYDEANRLQAALSPYNEANYFAYFDKMQAAYPADFFSRRGAPEPSDITPIFVVGMPRSGTSLVEQILASHSAVHGAGEVDIFPYVVEKLLPRLSGQNVLQKETAPTFLAPLADYYLKRLRAYSPDNKPYIVDKTPYNFFHIGLIRLLFPRAPIIHCARDAMDNCWSIFKLHFGGTHPYSYNQETLGRYYQRYQQLMQHWHRVLPGEIHDVHYEQLVADPEPIIRHMLNYCGLPWEKNCLNFYRTKRIVNTASGSQVRRPMYKTSLKSWEPVADLLAPLRKTLQ